jgi:hypothetical protein
MGVNVVDVEESDIEGVVFAISMSAGMTTAVGLGSVNFDAVANDDGGVGGNQENHWKEEWGEFHGGPTDTSEGREAKESWRRRRERRRPWGYVLTDAG